MARPDGFGLEPVAVDRNARPCLKQEQMTTEENKDSGLKKAVTEFLGRCGLEDLVIDREVHLNFTGYKDQSGDYVGREGGRRGREFFLCGHKSSTRVRVRKLQGTERKYVRAEYRDYDSVLKKIRAKLNEVRVLHSKDNTIPGHHFVRDLGGKLGGASFTALSIPLKKYGLVDGGTAIFILVWDYSALRYFLAIS